MSKDPQELSPTSCPSQKNPIPLPTEIPPPPDLSQLPPEVLHSGTVETLIGQNDDLTARLRVSIKRQSILEQEIHNLKKQNQEMNRYFEVLENKNQILKEKDSQNSQRQVQVEDQLSKLKEELQLYEIRYGELSNKYECNKSELAQLKEGEENLKKRFHSYRRRLGSWVKPSLAQFRNRTADFSREKRQLENKLEVEKLQNFEGKKEIQDLKQRELQKTQALEKQHRSQVSELVQHYEKVLSEIKGQREELKEKVSTLEVRETSLRSRAQKATQLSNEKVHLLRQLEELRQKHKRDLDSTQSDLVSYRSEAKTHALQVSELRKELHSLEQKFHGLKAENREVTDQLESLQMLWSQKQKDFCALEKKYANLQLVNRELVRRNHSSLSEVQKESTRKENPREKDTKKTQGTKETQQSLAKIEGLLAEIQSGHLSKKKRAIPLDC